MTPVDVDNCNKVQQVKSMASSEPVQASDDIGANSDGEGREQTVDHAHKFLAEGRRFFVCRNYQDAVDSLYNACSLFARLYGDMAIECAEVYFMYGKSLVELERVSQSVIAVKGDDGNDESECSDDEDGSGDPKGDAQESESDTVMEQITAVEETASVQDGSDIEATTKRVNNMVVEESGQAENLVASSACEKEVAGHCEPKNEPMENVAGCCSDNPAASSKPNDEHEDSNANTAEAWEMFDLARVIYEKYLAEPHPEDANDEDKKRKTLRLSEVRMSLGEVCALDEKYTEAIQEFSAAQEILKQICTPDDRRLAEILFQIGSASEMDGKYQQAAENIKMAAKILETRKKSLQSHLDEKQASEKSEDIKSEIQDLTEVLGDIDQRLIDLAESQRLSAAVKQDLSEFVTNKCPEGNAANSNSKEEKTPSAINITDVSHLVRKPLKRLSDEESNCSDAKRAKFTDQNIDSLEKVKAQIESVLLKEETKTTTQQETDGNDVQKIQVDNPDA